MFQGYNLLNRTSALENVELPLIYRGASARERRERALQALETVGLKGWESHTPGELSGGQQQRVAIARAIVTDPAVLLADEPTGNLDTARSREVMELLTALNHDRGITIIMVTHEADMAAYAKANCPFFGRSDRIGSAKREGRLMLWNTILLALRAIKRNVLRSFLTVLGIVIGVAAVITMVTIGGGRYAPGQATDRQHGQQPAYGHSGQEIGPRPVLQHRSLQGGRCRGHYQGSRLDCCYRSGFVPVHQGYFQQSKLDDSGYRKRQPVSQSDEPVHRFRPNV